MTSAPLGQSVYHTGDESLGAPYGAADLYTAGSLALQALTGQDFTALTRVLAEHGEPRYRARQLYRGLYRERVSKLADLTALPSGLRRELAKDFTPGLPTVDRRFQSIDGTVRYLLSLDDGKSIESVFIPEVKRDTLCISTQVGCPVDCKFCLTALMGLERNLTAGEIVGQVLVLLRQHQLEPRRRPVNIVMMGMGEPLLNLEAVLKASRLLAGPRRRCNSNPPHHGIDIRDPAEDAGTRRVSRATSPCRFVERIHGRDAAGAYADHAQVRFGRAARYVSRLSAASSREANV